MRMPSSTMRLRTIFLVSERTAGLISCSLSGNSPASWAMIDSVASSSAALRSALSVMRVGLRHRVGADFGHAGEHVFGVVDEQRVGDGRLGAGLGHELTLELDRLADPGLGRLEPVGEDLFGDLGGAVLVELPGVLGAARLDHHDGDLGVGCSDSARPATTSSKEDSSPSW